MTPQLPDTAPTNTTLMTLLDANLHLPPEYRDQLTNHLPMALHALFSLGASSQRMVGFYASYSKRFQDTGAPSVTPMAPEPPSDWRALRGQADSYPALWRHFHDAVARDGAHTTLRESLPDLMPGVAAAALHGVIRTAHAVESGHAGELAAALAYWAWRWQALAKPTMAVPSLGFGAWSARLVQEAPSWDTEGPLISIRMHQACQSAVYQALAGALQLAPDLGTRIRELAGLAVECYCASPNFTILHTITGLRALRTLLPWLESSEEAQAILAQNFVAAYLAARVVPSSSVELITPERSWEDVAAAAVASDDDHTIKLVQACRAEAQVYGQGRYLRAASLATR